MTQGAGWGAGEGENSHAIPAWCVDIIILLQELEINRLFREKGC